MMMEWAWVGVFVYACGFMSFVSRWKHILCVLLSLEMMMVSLFMMIVCGILVWGSGGWFGLIFLGMVVCEGAVGLGLVVSLVRSYGGDCLFGFIGDVGFYV